MWEGHVGDKEIEGQLRNKKRQASQLISFLIVSERIITLRQLSCKAQFQEKKLSTHIEFTSVESAKKKAEESVSGSGGKKQERGPSIEKSKIDMKKRKWFLSHNQPPPQLNENQVTNQAIKSKLDVGVSMWTIHRKYSDFLRLHRYNRKKIVRSVGFSCSSSIKNKNKTKQQSFMS